MNKNQPLLRRRTNRGNITLSVFRNHRVNRQTQQAFVADNLVIRTGYQNASGEWINSDISIDARLIPNLIETLSHVSFDLANNPAVIPAAPAQQQPATTPAAPEDEVVPF